MSHPLHGTQIRPFAHRWNLRMRGPTSVCSWFDVPILVQSVWRTIWKGSRLLKIWPLITVALFMVMLAAACAQKSNYVGVWKVSLGDIPQKTTGDPQIPTFRETLSKVELRLEEANRFKFLIPMEVKGSWSENQSQVVLTCDSPQPFMELIFSQDRKHLKTLTLDKSPNERLSIVFHGVGKQLQKVEFYK